MSDPLKPSAPLLLKLGSLIVHAEEALDPKLGSHFDLETFKNGLADPEVKAWMAEMRKNAYLPEKRTKTRGAI